MLYKIAWIEQKPTKDGKAKAEATLVGTGESENATGVKVTIWGDFPDYANIQNGGTIEGDIVSPKDSKYLPSLYPPKAPKLTSNGGYKDKVIKGAQDRKKGDIEHFQGEKEMGIRVSSCNNQGNLAAIAILEAEMRLHPHSDPMALWQELWDKCRNHLWNNWEGIKDNPPF